MSRNVISPLTGTRTIKHGHWKWRPRIPLHAFNLSKPLRESAYNPIILVSILDYRDLAIAWRERTSLPLLPPILLLPYYFYDANTFVVACILGVLAAVIIVQYSISKSSTAIFYRFAMPEELLNQLHRVWKCLTLQAQSCSSMSNLTDPLLWNAPNFCHEPRTITLCSAWSPNFVFEEREMRWIGFVSASRRFSYFWSL